MKILPIEKVREADAYTIEHEPIVSTDLMERAATQLCQWISANISKDNKITLVCGIGNNAGDALALARLLSAKEYNVEVYIIWYSDKTSDDFKINLERLRKTKSVKVFDIKKENKTPDFLNKDIIVDGIFGSGLSRPVEGFIAEVIDNISKSQAKIIAIDVPSGLFTDSSNSGFKGSIVNADNTLTFQFPKFAFLFPENEKYVGEWVVLPIGLHSGFIEDIEVKNYFVQRNDCTSLLKARSKFSHKGNFGHALLISGSYGKMGAAVLGAKACLRSGTGLLSVHVPKIGYQIIQTAIPEAMCSIDSSDHFFTGFIDPSNYNAIAIGPGIGMDKSTQNALKLLIQNVSSPMIFDADAINILGENKTWIPFLPKLSILTPHPKEFERLTTKAANDFERNNIQREFSVKYKVYVVLKGAHTAITCPDGSCYFNSSGNAGMATAGSGDVLTGIILGLLAQNYHPKTAAILGVYLHGLAGDIAAGEIGIDALIAGDITECLGDAFMELTNSAQDQQSYPSQPEDFQ
ncbi:MAG: NAD(P)H-hydrate dehydratase [Bacteroidales bacterium]|nr:NAD(P)H-hydrate dehydratase [Bacteroidales bacterium]